MKYVYTVFDTECPDESAISIFDSRENAQMFIDAFDKDYRCRIQIRVHMLNLPTAVLNKGCKAYSLLISRDGKVSNIRRAEELYAFNEHNEYADKPEGNSLTVHCFAKDAAEAIRIADARRRELLANDDWEDVEAGEEWFK